MSDVQVLMAEFEIPDEKFRWISVAAVRDGNLVGTCQVHDWDKGVPYITAFGVCREHRLELIGTHMVKEVAQRAAGKDGLCLWVHKENVGAVAFWKAMGFRFCGDSGDPKRMMFLPIEGR